MMKRFIAFGFLFVFAITAVQAGRSLSFSSVTSRQKAEALYAKGKLEKILLFPSAFGGKDIPQNTVFVPPGISDIKNKLDGTLMRFARDGLINRLEVKPDYKGDSFVPSKIRIHAWHTEKSGEFNPTIEIW